MNNQKPHQREIAIKIRRHHPKKNQKWCNSAGWKCKMCHHIVLKEIFSFFFHSILVFSFWSNFQSRRRHLSDFWENNLFFLSKARFDRFDRNLSSLLAIHTFDFFIRLAMIKYWTNSFSFSCISTIIRQVTHHFLSLHSA